MLSTQKRRKVELRVCLYILVKLLRSSMSSALDPSERSNSFDAKASNSFDAEASKGRAASLLIHFGQVAAQLDEFGS
jgi:hypothetical protein